MGIFTRAAGLPSPVWTVQFNEYSLLWMTFLGTAWVLSRRKHVAVDVITSHLGPQGGRVAEILHSLAGIAVCGVLCWTTFLMTLNLFQRGVTDVQAVDMPKSLVLAVIPAGFLVLTAQFLRNLLIAWRKKTADSLKVTARKASPGSVNGSPEKIGEGRNR